MSKSHISVSHLTSRVEDFILERLEKEEYPLKVVSSSNLLTSNRFDLGLKLAYLSLRHVLPELAYEIYQHDIRSQTLGEYKEYGSDKSSFNVYLNDFDKIFNDIDINGFDFRKTLIPLSSEGSILNGAHRVASAIFLDKSVSCVCTEIGSIYPDYKYFIERNVPEAILDIGAISFCSYSEGTYLAFLWPSGRNNYDKTECLFSNIVYKKKVKLNANGGLNLLVELYKHMEWVGTKNNNFPGAHQKLMECFTDFKEFTVILFQSESLSKVQELKHKVRDINGIGFSSIHITDTKEEVIRISKIIFNNNGLHFLNHAKPYRFDSSIDMTEAFKNCLDIDALDQFVLNGSMTLSLYGLREAKDIDYLSCSEHLILNCPYKIECHDSQLQYHGLSKAEVIFNPKYYFEYLGVRFVSFDQVYKFKKKRGEEKDVNDCEMMSSMINNKKIAFIVSSIRQYIFYKKILISNKVNKFILSSLKATGTYAFARRFYRKLRKVK